jgi:hypothetical protein
MTAIRGTGSINIISVLLSVRVFAALKFYGVFVPAFEQKNHCQRAVPSAHACERFPFAQKIPLSTKNPSSYLEQLKAQGTHIHKNIVFSFDMGGCAAPRPLLRLFDQFYTHRIILNISKTEKKVRLVHFKRRKTFLP